MSASPNRLIDSTSPYLLQHAHNPVDWYPWGEEALGRARAENRPIFLSIGYSACHWCHVMERESFENPAIAEILNREFVSIKVDREERPDLDEIYMTATQLMTQSGGWPMSVFLTPDLRPFYAGTYFPPEDRWGRPGFGTLLQEIARAWRERRPELEDQASRVALAIHQYSTATAGQGAVKDELVENAVRVTAGTYDAEHGGFGGAPKFPPSMRLELLLRRAGRRGDTHLLPMVRKTLDRMARGGMYDQVGGGFHRYSVDERWLVPHFEKMLYDNALLARVYALAHAQTGEWYYGRVAREILDYVLREMTHPDGGFYSATDADSEGVEGNFFVWGPEEVVEVLGEADGTLFNRIYDITPGGNFEGSSIPNLLPRSLEEWAAELGTTAPELDHRLAALRARLWEHRERRVHPLLDDKVLAGWNGLMIRAFAEGYRVFQDERYRAAAEAAARFVLGTMRNGERLLRSFRAGKAHLNAYLEDYAYLAVALLDLHEVTGEGEWSQAALSLLKRMDEQFWDPEAGAYFFTSHDHEELITRTHSLQDGATPSGNSMAALALIRAAKSTGDEEYRKRAAHLLSRSAPVMAEMSPAFPNMLVAADEYLAEWPDGVGVPGGDAVGLEVFLSRKSVAPGSRFWIGVRLDIRDGYHLNSFRPKQDYLMPTQISLEMPEGFQLEAGSYPKGTDWQAPFADETLSVYSGSVLLGAELEVSEVVAPGRYPLIATLAMQPCDDSQCYPPLQARVRVEVVVTQTAGPEQHPELFEQLRQGASRDAA
ncbi:MAG: thioredoxin domain-containing protein [Armatimonadota bacterium]